jgi:hypothetical protein
MTAAVYARQDALAPPPTGAARRPIGPDAHRGVVAP